MELLCEGLHALDPSVMVFVDRLAIDPGALWQQDIERSLEASQMIIPLITPGFLRSKPCMEEWAIAKLMHQESSVPVLYPLYTLGDSLPLPMRIFQYHDCRQADPRKIKEACKALGTELSHRC
jgi:hypothetical protein